MSQLHIAYSNHRRTFPEKNSFFLFDFIAIHACNYFTIPAFRGFENGGPFILFHVCPEMK